MNRTLERFPLLRDRQGLAFALTVLLCAIAWWLRLVLDPWFPPGFPFLTFFPAVIGSAFLFGLWPGVLAAVLCGFAALYWFIPPMHSVALNAQSATAMAFYAGVVGVDLALVHWMQRANARLAAERERSAVLAEERRELAEHTEVLFRELQHRVGNNLQMVGAVLALHRNAAGDPAVRQALADAANKLQLIGRIQRQLYGTGVEAIMLDVFLEEIVVDAVNAGSHPEVSVRFMLEPGIRLGPDAAIPVALVVTEAVANALEHAFPDGAAGTLHVLMAREDGAIAVEVADNGQGLPEGFDPRAQQSLGTRISTALAGRLQAQIDWYDAAPGTIMRLVMPEAISTAE